MLYRRFWLLDALLIAFISTSAGNRKLIGEHLPSKSVAKQKQEYESFCLGSVACRTAAHCLDCDFPTNCSIGSAISVNCSAPHCDDLISGNKKLLVRNTQCHFCWQLDHSQLDCEVLKNCSTNDVSLHLTICRTKSHVLCAGSRTFYKKIRCHWTAGYSWRKALFLSVTLGGFGVDRFYLGHWKSAIGKLFSFGGLGLWTLLDIVLIGIGYIQPADESLYI